MRPLSRQASLTTIALALLATLTALGFAAEASAGAPRITVSGAPVAPNDFRISDMGTDGVPGDFPAQPIPALAYNPSADQHLVVWSGMDGADGVERIYGQLVNARTGANVAPNDFLIGENTGLPGTASNAPAVAYNSAQDEFLVVWSGTDLAPSDTSGDAYEIYAQRVDADGSLIGGRLRVSSMGASDTATSMDAFDPDVAYNPAANEYLVVWEGDDNILPLVANEMEIFAQRLGFSGGNLVEVGSDDQRISTVGADGDPAPRAADPAIAYNSVNNEYLVLWDGEDIALGSSELYGQRLNAAGAEIGSDDFRIDNPPAGGDEVNDPAITYNPTANEYLALWQGEGPDGHFRLYAQRINAATGAQVGGDVLITDNTSSSSENVAYPQADYNPALDEYLVVWHGEDASGFGLAADEQEVFGRRYSPTLATVEAPFLISDMGPAGDVTYAAQSPAVAYSEASINGYMVIWRGDDNLAPLVNEEFEIFGQLVAPNANLAVTKGTATPERTIGQSVTYTVSYSNAGPDPILGATLTDLLPPELTPVSCTVGTFTGTAPVLRAPANCTFDIARLNSGQGGTLTVVGTLNPTGTNGQVVNNTATMDATTLYFDSDGANNSATAGFTVAEPVLDLATTLQTSVAAVDAGDRVRYQIRVAHRQSPAANFSRASAYNLQLSDTLPASLTSPTIVSAIVSDGAVSTNVAASFSIAGGVLQTTGAVNLLLNTNGASDQLLTVVVEGRVADSIAPASTINNSATVTWRNETGFQRASYTATGAAPTITVPGALSVVKTVVAPGSAALVGQTVTYQLSSGVIEGTTSNLQWVDTLPAGMSYVPGSATVSSANGMAVSGFAASLSGQTLTLRATAVVNPGNVDNPAAADSDSFLISYQATVNDVAGNVAGTLLTNDVDASADNVPSDSNNAVGITVVEPALGIDKSITTATAGVDAGDTLRYRIEVFPQAVSTANAFSLEVSDDLPAALQGAVIESATISDGATSTDVAGSFAINGSGDLVTLAPPNLLLNSNGASDQVLVIVIRGTVRDAVQPAGTIANAATVTWRNGAGTQRASYTATDLAPTITVPGVLSVTKSAAPAAPAPGDAVTYTLTTAVVEGTTNNLQFVDTLPAGLTYVPGSAAVSNANGLTVSGFTASLSGQVLTIDISSVVNPGNVDNATAADSDSFLISYQATVGAALPNGTALTNSVAATASGGLSDTNNTATVTVDVPPSVVSITRVGANPTNAGSVDFLVTFSEPVTGGASADFALATAGTITGASVGGVSGTGATRTITVNTGSGDGTIRLDLPGPASFVDSTGKALIGLPFTAGDAYTIDKTSSTATIELAAGQADPANAGPILFTVEFSEPIDPASFTGADVSLAGSAGATTAVVSGGGASYTISVSGMTSDGTVTASLAAGVVSDPAGNGSTGSTSTDNTVTYDATAPTVTVEQAAGQLDPASAGPILFTVEFSEPVTGFTDADVALSGTAGATTAVVSGSGASYSVAVSGMASDGTVIASIAAGAASDAAGNPNTASTSSDNSVAYDAIAPSVTIEQAMGQADPASAGPILFTVEFSEPVSGFTDADVVLSGTAGATTAVVSGSGASYTVTVSGMTGDGTVIASIAAGAASDAAGNPSAASNSADNTVALDTTAPSVTIEQAAAQADPANAGPILFEVTFSEPVTGFTDMDVVLSGTAGATTAVVSGSGASYSVAVSGMTGDGTVIASITAAAASDAAGNASAASTSSDNSVTYDATVPTVTIEQAAAQADPANAGPILFTVEFSEPVTGFDDTDVALSGTAGATTAVVSGSGASYSVAVSGMTSDGTVIASITAAAASDTAGNPSAASTSADNSVTFDASGPLVTINQGASQADPASVGPILFTVKFSEPVTGFATGDVSLGGTAGATTAIVTEVAPNDGTTFAVAVSGMTGDGTVTASLAAGVASDLGGNGSLVSSSTDNSVIYDATAPGVTIEQAAAQADPANVGPLSFVVAFSEPVAGFATDDVSLGGTAGATTAIVTEVAPNDGTTFDVAVSGMTGDGTVIASIAAGAASDAAGNASAASTSTDNSVTYDTTGPSVTVEQAAGQADPADAAPIRFAVTFSEPVTGFDDTDVTLGGTAGATAAAVTEVAPNDGTTFQIAVGGMTSAGTVTASVAAGAASDGAGNPSGASSSADNSVTFDPAAPVVTAIARADADPTNAAEVRFAVTFSAAVTGVDQSDFTLATGGGISGASVTGVSGSGSTRTVTVSTGAGSGTLRLDLSDDDSIVDGFSVALGGAGAGNGDFSGGQQYTLDRVGPQAGQLSVPAVVAGAADLTFTVVFSDNLGVSAASLATGAIQVSGPGGFTQAAELVGVSPAGDGTPRTATYRLTAPGGAWNSADNGDYSVSLAAGRVRDTVGNAAAAAALGDFTVGLSEPPALYRIHLPQVFQIGPLPWEFPYSRSR